jgi:hypothetical protein
VYNISMHMHTCNVYITYAYVLPHAHAHMQCVYHAHTQCVYHSHAHAHMQCVYHVQSVYVFCVSSAYVLSHSFPLVSVHT